MASRSLGLSATLGLLLAAAACSSATSSSSAGTPAPSGPVASGPPSPDPRIGLRPGTNNAGEAVWNLRVLSKTPVPAAFASTWNSDLAFMGHYVIQGNFNGYQIWDIADPAKPVLKTGFVCPASQSDVSTYRNLLFVSGEDLSARLDCGTQGVQDTVSQARLRGLRIFDITDLEHPKNVGNVQTCRGSHTHSVLVDPKDPDNVYVYISGSSQVRSPSELPGCIGAPQDPNSALFRIEVIKVPLAHPEQAAIVSSPRIFGNLAEPKTHGEAPADVAAEAKVLAAAKARGEFTATYMGSEHVIPANFTRGLLDSIVKARGATGAATAADTAALRGALQGIVDKIVAEQMGPETHTGPTQCHDITLYPAIGLAGGACAGYGFLIDIRDPAHPVRLAAAADSNFSYWHSATFNNDGTKVLFSDEWGGGGAAKCRATDPKEWGADALFTIEDELGKPVTVIDGVIQSQSPRLHFRGYYKLPVAQTAAENCVAHNGSLIPIPGRDVMAQAWYQGGVSVFDWTDAAHPKEIAFFDRGPVDSTRIVLSGSWSIYWYNGVLVSSEITRGLDIFELIPSGYVSQNEIDAAKTVRFDYLNTQGQRRLVWPPSFALARAYLDQLERSRGLANDKISAAREGLRSAEKASGSARRDALAQLASRLDADAGTAGDAAKTKSLAGAVRDLAAATR